VNAGRGAGAPRTPPRLIALSPGDLGPDSVARFVAALERALGAGLPGLLLREPRLSDRDYLALGARVNELRERGAAPWLGVHDRAHLARALGADAVHLSFRSLPPVPLRAWLGPGVALGLSTHASDDPTSWSAADYVFHGPLRDTPSKRGLVAPVGFDGIERALRLAPCPLLVLGGVTAEDVSRLRALGAHGVAVLRGILASDDPGRATAAYLAGLP
jgi:thiamine-phosphate pyrophosphorylase